MGELVSTSGRYPVPSMSAAQAAAVLLRPSLLDRLRLRRTEREMHRVDVAHQRIAGRMASLGERWRVLDLKTATGSKPGSFLAVGPAGIFSVVVKEHGRHRVGFAGDVVQIAGRRPKYVEEARATAKRVSKALSRQAGVSVPVMPVLAFSGSGSIVFYGMPKGCIVTAYQDLGRILDARGRRLADVTVDKVFNVATRPDTWINPPYVPLAERSRSQPERGWAGADK